MGFIPIYFLDSCDVTRHRFIVDIDGGAWYNELSNKKEVNEMIVTSYYPNVIPFGNLGTGEVFYSEEDSDYFMVTQEIETEVEGCIAYNAVRLSDGYMSYFKDEETIQKVRGEFKIR